MTQANADPPPSRPKLQDNYELPDTTKFSEQRGAAVSSMENGEAIDHLPPPLPAPTKTRKALLVIGFVLATLDLCILPITYFYTLSYRSRLTQQYGRERIL